MGPHPAPALRPFVTVDARELLVKLDGLSGAQTEQSYVPVSPDALPRALDHLNVAWTVLTGQRLFYPRGLAAPASLVEPGQQRRRTHRAARRAG